MAQHLNAPGIFGFLSVGWRPQDEPLPAGHRPRPLGARRPDHPRQDRQIRPHLFRAATSIAGSTRFPTTRTTRSPTTPYSGSGAYWDDAAATRYRAHSSRSSAGTVSGRRATSFASPRRQPIASASSPACSRRRQNHWIIQDYVIQGFGPADLGARAGPTRSG